MKHYTKCLMCGWKSEPGEIAHRCGGCGYSSGRQAGALLAFPADSGATPEPLSAKGLSGNEGGLVTGVQKPELRCRTCHWTGNRKEAKTNWMGKLYCPSCFMNTGHRELDVIDRLTFDMASLLDAEDLTPEARTLIGLALRVQRGETVDLAVELERRGR